VVPCFNCRSFGNNTKKTPTLSQYSPDVPRGGDPNIHAQQSWHGPLASILDRGNILDRDNRECLSLSSSVAVSSAMVEGENVDDDFQQFWEI